MKYQAQCRIRQIPDLELQAPGLADGGWQVADKLSVGRCWDEPCMLLKIAKAARSISVRLGETKSRALATCENAPQMHLYGLAG